MEERMAERSKGLENISSRGHSTTFDCTDGYENLSFSKNEHVVLLSKGKEVGKGIMIQSLPHEKLHGREFPRGTLGVAIQSALALGLTLPHVPPIDDDVCTLGAAVGTVVAWPIRELAKGQRTVSSGAKGSVPVAPRATSIASGAPPKPNVSKPPPKTLGEESTGVKKRSADQASEVVESKRDAASTKKEVTKAKEVEKPVKASAEGTTQSEVPAPSKDQVPIVNYSSEGDDEREDVGDEDHGLFTITEKSMLKWDLLDDTLHRLQD
ncbi:hypothetical protein GOP47_0015813 [Adiantum capillus-veneris]|uniref:DUF8039 domain-containing protein n=1 Tax=Adiantum capillus-veneris TaxID=13818 RepID=A0A9D4UKP8_ADICA|nr:hypothetical protein GOP47_0015813 [Adiantum capillus-veneris]